MTTPDEKVARHNEIKAFLASANKQFSELCAPYVQEQKEIAAWLHNFLHETKQNSGKTDNGTFYISVHTNPKIEDRTAYLDFCLDKWDEIGNELLQLGAPQMAAFKEYIEKHKDCPPGTSVSYFEKLNVKG